ncbi:SHOCT domain-containing protein [Synechococcus sp. CCY 9618]|uniref:SHOCT domain-containing protein n=1 Tax=Synechococcus sp. CCY 9618 TaxID=2815602 RepID=UPI001C250AF3|nr:SHOCT domain-containing protein [Synechococcus sp. CCY 9618]
MEQITEAGLKIAGDLARQYGFSQDAVAHMMLAMQRGRGGMAQFDHPEFAGSGQWMRGGMLMLGDMFNHSLKARVDGLCQAISMQLSHHQPQPVSAGSFQAQSSGGWASAASMPAMAPMAPMAGGAEPLFVPDPRDTWWPAELGTPTAMGSQNDMSYAFFPAAGRLAIQSNGQVSLYDTGHHQIAGVSQQQGSGGSVMFATPAGTVSLSSLSSVGGGSQQQMSHGGSQQQTSGMAAMSMQPMGMAPMAGFESWWPAELGSPSATGAQNNLRYAWFADSGCLAVEQDGSLRLLDARNQPIQGIASAGGSSEVCFTTPGGMVSLSNLPPFSPQQPAAPSAPVPAESVAAAGASAPSTGDVISALERLGELKAKGVLSEAEFTQKKTELLSRL